MKAHLGPTQSPPDIHPIMRPTPLTLLHRTSALRLRLINRPIPSTRCLAGARPCTCCACTACSAGILSGAEDPLASETRALSGSEAKLPMELGGGADTISGRAAVARASRSRRGLLMTRGKEFQHEKIFRPSGRFNGCHVASRLGLLMYGGDKKYFCSICHAAHTSAPCVTTICGRRDETESG